MKTVRTTVIASLIALMGASGLWWFTPVVLQTVVEILLYRSSDGPFGDLTRQLTWAAGWSAVAAVAFALGLSVAVGGLDHANRSCQASRFGQPLLLLAATIAMAAAIPLFCATGHFYLLFRALTATDATYSAEQLRQSLGPIHLGFVLLLGIAGALFAAGFAGISKQPRETTYGRLMVVNLGFTVFVGLVFAAAFVTSWACARHFEWLFLSHDAVPAHGIAAILYAIVVAQLLASACLAAFGVVLGSLACFVGEKVPSCKQSYTTPAMAK